MWFLMMAIPFLGVTISDSRVIETTNPPPQKRIACYYTNWSIWRPDNLRFTPEDLDPFVCTHLLYAYATLESDGFLVPFDPNQDLHMGGYKKFVDLRKRNPDLKLMLAVGGSKVGVKRFSKVAGDPELRKSFAQNAVHFLKEHKFDGLDLVWKYPGFRDGSSFNDKENYVELLKELKHAFRKEAAKTRTPVMVLSIIVPQLTHRIERGFDMKGLSKYADFMTIISYDYHSPTDLAVHHSSPTYKLPGEDVYKELNIDATVNEYRQRGVNLEKLNIAIPLFGLSFQLEEPEETDIGSLAGEEADEIEPGYLYYNELCQRLQKGNWTIKHANRTAVGPYAYKGKHWISYDDEDTIRNKAKYVIDHKLGGITFWTIDYDDFKGLCHNRTYPLINAAKEEFTIPTEVQVTTPQFVTLATSQEPPKTIEMTTAKIIRKPIVSNDNLLPVDRDKKKDNTKEKGDDNQSDLQSVGDVNRNLTHSKKVNKVTGSKENLKNNSSNQIIQGTKGNGIKIKPYENLNNFIPLLMPTLHTSDRVNDTTFFPTSGGSKLTFPSYEINGQRDIVFKNIHIRVTNNYAVPEN